MILFFFFVLSFCAAFASVRLHGFSEERGHFCNVISHHCFGAPRKGDAVSTPQRVSYPPMLSGFAAVCVRFGVFFSFLVNQSAARSGLQNTPRRLDRKQAAQIASREPAPP